MKSPIWCDKKFVKLIELKMGVNNIEFVDETIFCTSRIIRINIFSTKIEGECIILYKSVRGYEWKILAKNV